MEKKLYVGNIPYEMSGEDIKREFSEYGEVSDVFIVKDKNTGRPRGFAFVTFTDGEEADRAVAEMNGKEVGGRKIVVSEARPQPQRD
ncbi:RNA-binding protein [Candidatus Micrarchaeota archaeon]|nr:RNA-binding protein [Candidatus Micrarchaeota archaeon]